MPQSLSQIYVHIIFSTKHREPFLRDRALRTAMHKYLAGICAGQGSPAIIVGGTEDHVHVLCRLSRTGSVADLLRELKRDSSAWVKEQHPELDGFHWQLGYGAFSVGPHEVDVVRAYIENQEAHHRTESFQDEFRALLATYGVEYHEHYVWD